MFEIRIAGCVMRDVVLKRGRERSLKRRHPWVFSGAIERVAGDPKSGDAVCVRSANGEFLGWGVLSKQSQIRIRIWSWQEDVPISRDLFDELLSQSIGFRAILGLWQRSGTGQAVRLVNAEADGLPGVVVDLYNDVLVGQFLTSGAERWKAEIVDLMVEMTGVKTFYERSDVDVRKMEGLPESQGVLWGKEPPAQIEIQESGIKYLVDVRTGHKTGFYLDQRDNRKTVSTYTAGKEVLNCFSYTGGFSLAALAGGARSVVSVDSSREALAIAQENLELNMFPEGKAEWLEGDVFEVLRQYREAGRTFDLIILDPPKFASSAGQLKRAERGYKDINLLAFKLLRPGGLLFTFSCSGLVTAEAFQTYVAWGALDAGVEAKIFKKLSQAADHPIAPNFPEGEYLKGLALLRQ